MENNFEDIDNLFKEELGGYTEVPPPPVWQALEKRLDNDRKRRVFPFRWFWYISLISFVLLGASVAFKIANDNHPAVVVNTTATEDGTTVSKTQEATPAPNTPANATPIANNEHPRKKAHHRHIKKQANHNNWIAVKANRKCNPTISKTAIASAEQKIPAKSRQQENYNSSTSGLYAYEEEDTEPVKNTQVVSAPQAKETHDGYVVNKTRKHNLVAADMQPVTNEEKTVANRREARTNDDEQNDAITDDHTGTRVAQLNADKPAPAVDKPKKKKTAAVVNPSTGVTHKDQKITPAASYTSREDAPIAAVMQPAVKKNTEAPKQMASSRKTHVNKLPDAATPRNSEAGATANINPAPKHKVIASKITPVKTATEPVVASHPETGKSAGNEFARQKKNRQKPGTGTSNTITPAAIKTPNVASSGPAKVQAHPVSAPVTKETKQASTIPSEPAKTTVAAKSPGKKLIALAAVPSKIVKPNKLNAIASVPAPPVSKKSGNKISSPVQNVEQEKREKADVAATTIPKKGTRNVNKTVAVAIHDHVKSTAIPASEKGAPRGKQQIAKKIAAKATGSKQTVASQKKNPAGTYAAAAQPQLKNAAIIARPNNPVSARPSLNSNMGSIEEPSIIDAPPQATQSYNDSGADTDVKQPLPVAAAVSPVAADSQSLRLNRFSYGVKSGFEAGFRQGAAGKFLIAPYLEYKLSSKISLMTQPAIKASYLGSHTIGNASIYYDTSHSVYNYTPTDSYTIHMVTGGPDPFARVYTYSETHDSISKSYIVGGTYVEFELPLLLKYNITPRLSVYGGLNMGYSKLMKIKESTSVTSVDFTKQVITVAAPTQAPPDPATQLGSVVFAGSAIGNYSGPAYPSQSGGMFRLGYMLGFSYEIKKRWMVDALIQQAKANSYIQGGYNVNTALSLPYFRLTLGYRLSK